MSVRPATRPVGRLPRGPTLPPPARPAHKDIEQEHRPPFGQDEGHGDAAVRRDGQEPGAQLDHREARLPPEEHREPARRVPGQLLQDLPRHDVHGDEAAQPAQDQPQPQPQADQRDSGHRRGQQRPQQEADGQVSRDHFAQEAHRRGGRHAG